jgi:integrase/recombinase XerD
MGDELVTASTVGVPALNGQQTASPAMVERAGSADRFASDRYFCANHHNPHTQKPYMRAVRQFPGWAGGQGVELAANTPGIVDQYLVGLGGSPAKCNQHPAALCGFFDRLVNRHVCILNPAAAVLGVKDQVVEGKTPEIKIEQPRKLLASETNDMVGPRGRAILGTLA